MSDPTGSGDHRRYRELLGAYALGLLDNVERAELERHLEGCETCRAEAAELRAVAALLPDPGRGQEAAQDRPPASLSDPLPTPPPDLEDRVVDAVLPGGRGAGRQTAWRRIGGGVAAAAAAVVAVVVGISLFLDRDGGGPPELGEEEPIAFSEAPRGVSTEAAVVAHTWGTEVVLEVEGLEAGEVYAVNVEREAGSPVPAGTFVSVEGDPVECRLNGAVLRQDASAITVADASSGETVLRSELAPRPDLALSGLASSAP